MELFLKGRPTQFDVGDQIVAEVSGPLFSRVTLWREDAELEIRSQGNYWNDLTVDDLERMLNVRAAMLHLKFVRVPGSETVRQWRFILQ